MGSRLTILREIVREGFDEAPAQLQGFLVRVLGREHSYAGEGPLFRKETVGTYLDAVRFDGYPALARAGYTLACSDVALISAELTDKFIWCINQQRGRPVQRQTELAQDSLALLGIADGLRAVATSGNVDPQRLGSARKWVRELVEQHGAADLHLGRARLLASDLLDEQGRFGRRLVLSNDARVSALDLCLWHGWTDVLDNVEHPDTEQRRDLFKKLLTDPLPVKGELLHAASWLCAFDVLTGDIAVAVVTDVHQVARILAETQGSLRRWRWEERPTRQRSMPARWLIDKEADVQAFLLAVLYPYFVEQLEDEQYLHGFGLRQGRFDFAITTLRLIVEVKVIRTSGDIRRIEAEIADDLALYFKESNPFRGMIVYIYDDRDRPEPEKYPGIRDALKRRSDKIVDVILVRRPSMIPDRDDRVYRE